MQALSRLFSLSNPSDNVFQSALIAEGAELVESLIFLERALKVFTSVPSELAALFNSFTLEQKPLLAWADGELKRVTPVSKKARKIFMLSSLLEWMLWSETTPRVGD